MKDYTVEVLEKYSHGPYGKQFYFGMIVCADNKQSAQSMVEELVDDMTDDEFIEWCTNDAKSYVKYVHHNKKPETSYRTYVGC